MIGVFFSDTGFDTTDLLIILAGIAYLVNQVFESKGWSRSSKRLREENQDLVRRNEELVEQVNRHEESIAELKKIGDERQQAIATLKAKVDELERLSQAKVLERLLEVEEKADHRHEEMLGVLQMIATNTSPPVHTIEDVTPNQPKEVA